MRFNKPLTKVYKIPVDYLDEKNLIAIDTLKIDKHYRITFTKEVKDILPIRVGDTIAIYKNRHDNSLVFRFQRGVHGTVIDNWVIKRNVGILLDQKDLVTKMQGLDPAIQKYLVRELDKTLLEKEAAPESTPVKKILIVDDDKDVLITFKSYLDGEGYKIEVASSSEEALKRLSEIKDISYFDLVIIDIRMPNINGLQLYYLIKAMNPSIKVLFASALDAADEMVSMLPAIDSGKNVLRKPVTRNEFISKVKSLI